MHLISDVQISVVVNASSTDSVAFPQQYTNIALDAKLTTLQLITKYGYKAEVHHVTTEDGYILEMHRITGGPKSPPRKGKKVCLLLHGIFDTSATWVLSGPNHALGFLLSDRGFDVWLGNSRGNIYSTNHKTLNPFGSSDEKKKFWSFSWHEMGVYDLPAFIDYILTATGEQRLQYIGHSQGTTEFFVMASEKPEFLHKVDMMHALAPIAYLSHVISPTIRVIAPFVPILEKLAALIGINYVNPTEYLKMAMIYENLIFLTVGYITDQLNTTLLPVIMGHIIGASTLQLIHYGQEVNSGHFRQYDYGRIKNMIRYKRLSPPDYKLANLVIPTAVYYSRNDWVAMAKDTKRLLKELPNVVNDYLVPPHKKFNHIDFLWGIDAPFLVYEEILRTMKSQNLLPDTDIDNQN